jgi:electron transport complex protein RnfB
LIRQLVLSKSRFSQEQTAFLSDNGIFKIHFASVNAPANKSLADQIEDLLPQTQCTKCGYPSCRLYAEAIANGDAQINQCPPGGAEGIARIAGLLDEPIIALNPDNGIERPRPVAVIDESLCIGCTLCIQACPVDAILGGAKLMHTIITDLCTGCDLCVAPCPVDCIAMVPVTGDLTGWAAWSQEQADAARARHDLRNARLQREKAEHEAMLAERVTRMREAPTAESQAEQDRKKAIIDAAIARARQKKAEP